MLTLPIQKDLAKYEPKIVGKFTKRTLVCTVCAIAAALLMAFYLNAVICVDIDDWGWLVVAIAVPFWAVGFWKPDGMKAEQWLPLWAKHVIGQDVIEYRNAWHIEEIRKEVEDVRKEENGTRGGGPSGLDRAYSGRGCERMRPSAIIDSVGSNSR